MSGLDLTDEVIKVYHGEKSPMVFAYYRRRGELVISQGVNKPYLFYQGREAVYVSTQLNREKLSELGIDASPMGAERMDSGWKLAEGAIFGNSDAALISQTFIKEPNKEEAEIEQLATIRRGAFNLVDEYTSYTFDSSISGYVIGR